MRNKNLIKIADRSFNIGVYVRGVKHNFKWHVKNTTMKSIITVQAVGTIKTEKMSVRKEERQRLEEDGGKGERM